MLFRSKNPSPAFVAKVGPELAALLWEHHGPGLFDVPQGPVGHRAERASHMRRAIINREGSASDLASRFGVATRTVKRHRALAREDGSDLPLLAPLKDRS